MIQKTFTHKDVGAAVVLAMPGGGSVSGKIIRVLPSGLVEIRFAVRFEGCTSALVAKKDWHRITLFPRNSLFLVQ